MKCAANIRNFFGKFAVYCKFLMFLGEICSALQISFCRTDNTFCKTDNTFCKTDNLSIICISENLYLFSFIARNILSFLSPDTFYSMRIYKPMLWLSY